MDNKILRLSILSMGPFVFIILLALINSDLVDYMDKTFSSLIISRRLGILDKVFKLISKTSDGLTVAIIILFLSLYLYFLKDYKKLGLWLISMSIINMFVLAGLLKYFFDRPRPDMSVWLVQVSSPSFPSGHSVNASVTYGALAYLFYKWARINKKPGWTYKLALIFFIVLVILVMFSRIYLGVHYLTDVIAGGSIGLSSLLASIYIWESSYGKR